MSSSDTGAVKAAIKPQNRNIILFFAAFMQFSVGISYIWSVFVPFVMKEYGWNATTTSMTYTVMVIAFVLGGTIGGRIQDKLSPKVIVILGGIIMALGSFLSCFTPTSNPFFLYATFGILSGFGMGFIYNTAIALSQKWFYDKRGFAGGVVVSTLGFAGFIFAPLFNYVIATVGLKNTYLIITVFYIIISLFSSIFVKNPPQGYGENTHNQTFTVKQYSSKEMIKTPNFYVLLFSLTCGVTAYILISPFLMTIGGERGISTSVLLAGVMASALMNAIGRLVNSSLSDIIGRKKTLVALFILSLICCVVLVFARGYMLVITFAVLSFAYGGFFATYPAVTTDLFGIKHSGSNYGLVMLGLGMASLLSMLISTIIQSMGWGLTARFISTVIIGAIGIVLVVFIKKPKQD